MMNDEKKKINDKKYIRKNTIVGIIGVILIAILFITCIDANAFDDLQGTFIPFDDFVLHGSNTNDNMFRVTLNDGIAAGATVNISFIIKTDVIKNFYATIYRNGSYSGSPMISSTSNYSGGYYNSYSTHYLIQTGDILQITVPKSAEIYGLYLYYVEDDGTPSMNDYAEIVAQKLVELNTSKYINQMINIDAYEDDLINLYSINEGYATSKEYYVNSDNTITVNGQIAITNGVSYYRLTIDNISKGIIDNPTYMYSITEDFELFVNSQNLNITNYNNNGYYEFFLNLDDYVNQAVSISVNAVDVNGISYHCFSLPIVYVYEPEIETETDSDTETDEPDDDYNIAYEKGFQDALNQLAKTPLYNATVNGTIVIEDGGSVTSTSKIEYKISILTNKNGFALSSIKPLIDIVQENNPNSTVYLSELSITFDREVVFTNDLVIFGTQKPILAINDKNVNSEGYVSYYNPTITFKGKYDTGLYKEFEAFYFWHAPLDNIYGNESPFAYAMRISDTDWLGQLYKISFTDMILDTNSEFLESIIYIPYDAYVKLADAEAYGNINGWQRGFEQGKQSASNVSYQKGFEAGKLHINNDEYTRGYWDGVEAGDSLRNVILAPFDGISGVFHNMLSVNILGFELDDIIGAILLMLLVIWIGKKVM